MSSTTFAIRLAKTLAVFGIGVMAFLVSFGNITDYYSNYYFVEHVMKMDTTFPKNELMYRSIKTDTFFHIAYIFLIGLECIMTFCCFYESKVWSIYGLMLGIIIWFLGFQVIGVVCDVAKRQMEWLRICRPYRHIYYPKFDYAHDKGRIN